ncbi:hypothetical protein PROFUN_09412 [Planoprotostelium fungivorum]|uniref:Potassium channel tetramerisation-type BTB domain-containing protein n=1 Tax=Planoprotostelium fungivorum TaxID=1890364 RepID=A0A2P6NHG8_9EUKA|nr:hypothetical protein PROFUN_09412 [Planoprotostelium fungivorum]
MPTPISINLRDSNNFFRSGSSVESLDMHSKLVIIFQNPNNGEPFVFDTHWGVVLKEPSNLLTFPVDEHSRMFVDRQPGAFSWILSYLQTGNVDITPLNPQQRKLLADDIVAFDMKGLMNLLPQLQQ